MQFSSQGFSAVRGSSFHFRIKAHSGQFIILNSVSITRPRKSKNTTTFASLLTSVIRQPLVEFPLEDGAVELGALLLTEILGSLRTVLMERGEAAERSDDNSEELQMKL